MGKLTSRFDPETCRRTCHPVIIRNPRWKEPKAFRFCKGIQGPLTEDQIREYCR